MAEPRQSLVLVVEDDDALGEVIATALAMDGHKIVRATTAAEARKQCGKFEFDAYVVDITLPGESGLSFARWLRDERFSGGILFVTGRAGVNDMLAGFETGADDYITKPFDIRVLRARVKALERRLRPAVEGCDSPVIKAGGWSLWLERRVLVASDEGPALPLTRREVAILAALMRRPGIPVSRETLLSLIDSEGEGASDRAVDYHVCNLRKKLEARPQVLRIQTAHGVGYTLTCE